MSAPAWATSALSELIENCFGKYKTRDRTLKQSNPYQVEAIKSGHGCEENWPL